jgi:hypothetical protein
LQRLSKLTGSNGMMEFWHGRCRLLRGDHIMRNLRFNISSILGMILFLGVGFAALRESNDYWDSGLFTLTFGVLMVSILLAVHRSEARRAFWVGFALFGWVYLALSLVPSIEARLLTTKALGILRSRAHNSNSAGIAIFDYDNDGRMDLYVANSAQPDVLYRNRGNGSFQDVTAAAGLNPSGRQAADTDAIFLNLSSPPPPMGSIGTDANFRRIGHSLLALAAALLGGRLSRRLHRGSRPPEVSTASGAEG